MNKTFDEKIISDILIDSLRSNNNNITIEKYITKDKTIYLRFDYGLGGTMRIAQTIDFNKKHTYNIHGNKNLTNGDSLKENNKYYIIYTDINIANDIILNKIKKKKEILQDNYQTYLDKNKSNIKGYWKNAEVIWRIY